MTKNIMKLVPTTIWQMLSAIVLINSVLGLLLFTVLLIPRQQKLQSLKLDIYQAKQRLILDQQQLKQLPLLEEQIRLLKHYYQHHIWSANSATTVTALYDMTNQYRLNTVEITATNKHYTLTGKASMTALLTFLKALNYRANTLIINHLHLATMKKDNYQLNLEIARFSPTKTSIATNDDSEPLPQFIYEKRPDAKQPIFFSDKNIQDLRMIGYMKNKQHLSAFVKEKQSQAVTQLNIGQYLSQQHMKIISITPDYLELISTDKQHIILPLSTTIKILKN
ncbi:MAG: pilus assembly protein PilP [Pseudomonadota bacterium]